MSNGCPRCDPPPAPSYPIECKECGISYGPGSQVDSHRPGSYICLQLRFVKVMAERDAAYKHTNEMTQAYENWIKSRSIVLIGRRIKSWVEGVLGKELFSSQWERSMRVVEEAIEFGQAAGLSYNEMQALFQRAYKRPVGKLKQEAAGIYVCLIAWAASAGVDLGSVLSEEVNRIEHQDRDKIRLKQTEKHSSGTGLLPT